MNDPNNNQWDNSQNNNGNNPNQQMNNNMNNNPQNNYNPQNNMDENSIITGLFYKFDRKLNRYRLAKTKTISLALFFFMLLFGLWATYDTYGYLEGWDFIGALILALIVTIPVFIIGFIIGKLMEDNNTPNMQYNPQMPNNQYNPQMPNNQYNPQMPNNQYNPQMPNNQYNPQMPNGPYNPQMPNNQYNPQMPEQQTSNLDYIPPNNQPNPEAPNNQVPNEDFHRVNTQEATNTQSKVDNTQHYYNPPNENTQEESQNMDDTEDTNIQENTSDDLNNEQNPSEDIHEENTTDNPNTEENIANNTDDNTTEVYYNMDNLGTNHDTVEKATAYWLGERFQSEYKPPFTMYIFDNADDAEKALLELPYIHKAIDTGKLICDEVFIYGYYKVSDANYEAIICGKDLTYEQFTQAEEAFEKYGGKRKNNLEPEKTSETIQQQPLDNNTQNKESSVKFREKITKDQFTYECYDADNKNDALEFLKQQHVNQRLYYICVYTPEGDYGKDIDGVYQM